MLRNLSLSITTCINKGVTCYEYGGRKRCRTIDRDLERSVVGASGSELKPSGQEDLRVVKTSMR